MRRIGGNHYAYATFSPLEINEVTGGFMLGLMMKLSAPDPQQDGTRSSRRRSEVIQAGAGYVDPNGNFALR